MKILKSIENALAKREAKIGRPAIATIRRDVVQKAIERGEFEQIILAYSHTDDFSYDVENKIVTSESLLKRFGLALEKRLSLMALVLGQGR